MALIEANPSTLKDVAREAGVSLATVDRVLHGRPGVSGKTVRKVKETIERLGFRPLAAAAQLARVRNFRIAYMLPRGNNRFMAEVAENVRAQRDWFGERRISVEVIETQTFDANVLAEELARAAGRFDGVAVVALDHPRIRAAIDDLVVSGVHVVTLVSDVPTSKRAYYVGIDNIAAGRTAATLAGRFIGRRTGRVGLISASLALRDHAERVFGFSQVLALEYPGLSLVPALEGRDDVSLNRQHAARLLAEEPELVAIYNTGDSSSGIGEALISAGRARDVVFIGHDLTPPTRRMLVDGIADALIVQDPGHEARSAARVLFSLFTGGDILMEQERIRVEVMLRDNLP